MPLSIHARWGEYLIFSLLPILGLYFFAAPTLVDLVCLLLIALVLVFRFRLLVSNLFGFRGVALLLFVLSAALGLGQGAAPSAVLRDLVSLLPLLLCPFGSRTDYKKVFRFLVLVSFLATTYQIVVVIQNGFGRAHFYYINSMIPFCNIVFAYALYMLFVNRRSLFLGVGVFIIGAFGVVSTGSKINFIIALFSLFLPLFFPGRLAALGFMAALIVGVLYLAFSVFEIDLILISRLLDALSGADSSTLSRVSEFREGMIMIEGREWLGAGLGASIHSYGREISYFHISPLYFFFKFGLVSLIFLVLLCTLIFHVGLVFVNDYYQNWYRYAVGMLFVILFFYMLVFPSYKYFHMSLLFNFFLAMVISSRGPGGKYKISSNPDI